MDPVIQLARQYGIELLEHEPLSRHTAFRIGGPARYFAVADPNGVGQLYSLARHLDMPFALIGNGSNLLARDEGFHGIIARLSTGEIRIIGRTVRAPAGMLLSALANSVKLESLSGLEFAQGIPGSVGGAVYMNAGAYGGQISDTLLESLYIDLDDPSAGVQRLQVDEHRFVYRHSAYMEHPNWVVVEAVFALSSDSAPEIAAKMTDYAARRREKQPLEYPSAGSAYKRPEGHFAGQLIEEAGLKGYRVGGAQVSEKHAGFIVNRGGATCADVLALMAHIEAEVLRQFGVALEREIRLL